MCFIPLDGTSQGITVKPKHSTNGTAIFSCLRGAHTLLSRQKARSVPEEAAWGHAIRPILQENWFFTIDAVPPGELPAEHQFGTARAAHG